MKPVPSRENRELTPLLSGAHNSPDPPSASATQPRLLHRKPLARGGHRGSLVPNPDHETSAEGDTKASAEDAAGVSPRSRRAAKPRLSPRRAQRSRFTFCRLCAVWTSAVYHDARAVTRVFAPIEAAPEFVPLSRVYNE